MSRHPTHDFSLDTGWCLNGCMTHDGQLVASAWPCVPSTDDSRPCDCEPALVEVDYAAITRGAAGC